MLSLAKIPNDCKADTKVSSILNCPTLFYVKEGPQYTRTTSTPLISDTNI